MSNVGPGSPDAHDNNGFISQMSPDGRVVKLRWITGGPNGTTLDAPKGLAICRDTLVVADVGAVHYFDRHTGALARSVKLPGLMINDIACARDGSIWVTDTGPSHESGGSADTSQDIDAIWRVDAKDSIEALARGLELDGPNGIVLDGDTALVATYDADRIERVTSPAAPTGSAVPTSATTLVKLPGSSLDALRRLPDGSLVVTSWDARAVYRLSPTLQATQLLGGVTSPAGVAVDTRRHRLAVTSMQTNTLYLLPLP